MTFSRARYVRFLGPASSALRALLLSLSVSVALPALTVVVSEPAVSTLPRPRSLAVGRSTVSFAVTLQSSAQVGLNFTVVLPRGGSEKLGGAGGCAAGAAAGATGSASDARASATMVRWINV